MISVRARATVHRSDIGWLLLAAYIIGYELTAGEGELLTHGAERYLASHPWIWRAVVGFTAGHLLGILPESIDPYRHTHVLYVALRVRKRHGIS
jgi:hypothetical protein